MRRELTLDQIWHNRAWSELLKHFSTALTTFFHTYTDSFAIKSFIWGATSVAGYVSARRGDSVQCEEIVCFETYIIWGY